MKRIKLIEKPDTQYESYTCGLRAISAVSNDNGMKHEENELRACLGTNIIMLFNFSTQGSGGAI
jgi:hypothetical protein